MESASLSCPFCFKPFDDESLLMVHMDYEHTETDEQIAQRIIAEENRKLQEESEKYAQKLVKDEKREENAPLKLISCTPEEEVKLRDAKDQKFHQEFATRTLSEQNIGKEEDVSSDVSVVVFLDVDNSANKSEFVALTEESCADKILVYAFGGPALPSVPTVKLPMLAEMYRQKRLRLVHCFKSSRNASDFALSLFAGMIHAKIPVKIPFIILSKDKGLRHVQFLLRAMQRPCFVIGDNLSKYLHLAVAGKLSSTNAEDYPEEKDDVVPTIDTKQLSLDQMASLVMDALLKMSDDQRPRTLKRLINTIGAAIRVKEDPQDEIKNKVVQELVKRNLIIVNGTSVQFLF